MRLVYSGVHLDVEIADTGIIAKRDEPTDVPDSIAAQMLEQDCWTEAAKAPATSSKGGK